MGKKLACHIHTHLRRVTTWLRTAYWRTQFEQAGVDLRITGKIAVQGAAWVTVGNRVVINPFVTINAKDTVLIGDDVHISSGTIISSAGLDYRKTGAARGHLKGRVHIDNGVWIGAGAIINPGVRIGEHAVIGAGAVVTRDVEAETIVAGVPARALGTISQERS
ncbi:MAG TPA: acyltransferase [Candidatus Paceibacterota bacterium]|nr:acyltransferase [Candidatus Paceibacterota bacterium]